jgi:hypothetical protein
MLCGSHFCPFSPISRVKQWQQAKPGEMLNSAAECADRARIEIEFSNCFPIRAMNRAKKVPVKLLCAIGKRLKSRRLFAFVYFVIPS